MEGDNVTSGVRAVRIERSIAICVFRNDGRILVARGFDDVSHEYFLRPLGGEIEPGETPEQALRRELLEETGLAIENVVQLGTIDNEFTYRGTPHRETVVVFDASFVDPQVAMRDRIEIHEDIWEQEARWIDPNQHRTEPLYPAGLSDLLATAD